MIGETDRLPKQTFKLWQWKMTKNNRIDSGCP